MSTRPPQFLTKDRAFSITGAWDVFHKFNWEVRLHSELARREHGAADRLALRETLWAAINAASTAWSLVEWIWIEAEADPDVRQRLVDMVLPTPIKQASDLKHWVRKSLSEMDACWHIAHQSKHGEITRSVDANFLTRVYLWNSGGFGSDKWRQHGSAVWTNGVDEYGEPQEVSTATLFRRVATYWEIQLNRLSIKERKIDIALEPFAERLSDW